MTDTDSSQQEQIRVPDTLPVLALRDIVIFPYMIVPLFVSRERSIHAVEQALADNRIILLVAQRDAGVEEPSGGDLYAIGTAAMIMRMLKLPDNRIRVLVQGISRVRVTRFSEGQSWLQASVEPISEPSSSKSLENEALARNVRSDL